METINSITLPSFLRRTVHSSVLKAHIKQVGCELHRVGRSRHWQMNANFEQIQAIIAFIDTSNEPSWLWLAKRLKSQHQQLSHSELLKIASRITPLSLSALMAKSDCTIAQARQVLDELEGLD